MADRLYSSWNHMRHRCRDVKDNRYSMYGGRGIDYPPEWESFGQFKADMGDGFKPGLSLDRINNNLGYSKLNCRWATPKEQSNNRRSNRLVTIGGNTKTLAQWIELSPVKRSTVSMRLHNGWPVIKALEKEVYHR